MNYIKHSFYNKDYPYTRLKSLSRKRVTARIFMINEVCDIKERTDCEDNENRDGLILNFKKSRLSYSGKHLHGSLFQEVAVVWCGKLSQ